VERNDWSIMAFENDEFHAVLKSVGFDLVLDSFESLGQGKTGEDSDESQEKNELTIKSFLAVHPFNLLFYYFI
jgi:hypothetical protein